MSGINSFGFGEAASEADTADFESETAGGNGHKDDSTPRDDHSDDVGWDQTTDVKSIEGAGKEPKDDDEQDKGTGVRKPADDKAKDKADDAKKDGDGDDDDDKGGDDDKADDLPEGVKRRVARANRQRDRLAAENEELRQKLAEKETPKDKAKDEPAAAPKAEDFDDYEDYLQAKKDFEAKPAPKKEDEPKPDDKKPAPDRELVGAVKEIEATLADAGHADLFKQVVESKDVDVTRDMAIAIAELENPETVLQAFLDNPALSKEIADLRTPTARLKRLVALDQPYKAKAAADDKGDGKDKAKPKGKDSEAPPPIDETNGNARDTGGYDGLSFREFEQRRNSEEKASKDFW